MWENSLEIQRRPLELDSSWIEGVTSVSGIYICAVQTLYPEQLTTSYSQGQTDRLPDWTERGAGKRKLSQEDKVFSTFYFFHLPPVTQMTEQSAAAIKLSSSAVWEIFALCNLWSTGAVDKEADTMQATDRDKRSDSHSLACHSTAPPYLQRRRCSWHPVQPPNPSPSSPLKRIRPSKYIRSPQEASPNRRLSRLNIKDKKKRSSAFEGSPGAYGK